MKNKSNIIKIAVAVILSAAMLSACSSNTAADDTTQAASDTTTSESTDNSDETTSADTESNANSEASDTTENSSDTDTVELTEEQLAKLADFYNTVDFERDEALAKIGTIYDVVANDADSTITYSESLTKGLIDKLTTADNYRIILKDDVNCMETAAKGENIKLTVCADDVAAAMIFNGNTVYSYSPLEMSAYKITLEAEEMAEYTKETLLESAVLVPEEENPEVSVYNLELGGKKYTYEFFTEGYAYIFNENGEVAMVCDGTNNLYTLIEIDTVSDDTFALLDGYDVLDFDEMLSSLEENLGDETNSEETTDENSVEE